MRVDDGMSASLEPARPQRVDCVISDPLTQWLGVARNSATCGNFRRNLRFASDLPKIATVV